LYLGSLRHPRQRVVYKRIVRPRADCVAQIACTYTGFLVDRLGKVGAMEPEISPLCSEWKICGPAVTVLGPDLAVRRAAADVSEPGDILVVAPGPGSRSLACFGDGTARKMRLSGVKGIVLDAPTRDGARLRALGFPCFCRGTSLINHDYPVAPTLGAVNVPVACGGVIVYPGDLILADADGVLVIPAKMVPELAAVVVDQLKAETRERLELGVNFKFGAIEELRQRGYQILDEEAPVE
jgi:4-hydroxy-4-methyl-2-oxoglutarate aldolase